MVVRIVPISQKKSAPIRDYALDSDETLIDLFQNGDAAAFHYLIERHRGLIWAQVKKYFGPSADGDDIVQDICLSLWKNRMSWKPGIAKFSTWLHRVASNRCIDILRQKREVATDSSFDHISSSALSAEDRVSESQLSRQLKDMLASLPVQQKIALQLFYYEDAEISQICSRMDLSEDSVRSLLKRGKQKLRTILQPEALHA